MAWALYTLDYCAYDEEENMDWLFDSPWTFWLMLALLFAIIEMLSLDLFFLMLSLSALITSAISPLIEHFFARGIVFAVLCILFVLILRPPLLKRLNRSAGNTVTNAKALRGKTVLVTEDVTAESGLVRLEGEIWTARTSGAPIPSGSYAQVETINGATAFVYPHVSTLPEGSAITSEAE